MYKVIAFDLDGTLVDSIHDIAFCMNKVLENNNLPIHELDSYKNFIGEGAYKLAMKASNNCNTQKLFEQYNELANDLCTKYSILFDNVKDVLATIKEKYKVAIITNKPSAQASKVIKYFFDDFFDFTLGQSDDIAKKPNREPMDTLLEYFNVSESDVLYVGDSHIDYEFACNSNVDVLILTYGYSKDGFLDSLEDNIKIDNFKEILKKLK